MNLKRMLFTFSGKATPVFVLRAITTAGSLLGTMSAVIPLGNGDLQLTTSANAGYDSHTGINISSTPGGSSSGAAYFYSLSPQLTYSRFASTLKMNANVGIIFNRYIEHKELSTDNRNAGVTFTLPTDLVSNVKSSFSSSYNETSGVDKFTNQRVGTDSFSNNLTVAVPVTQRGRLTFGGALVHTKNHLILGGSEGRQKTSSGNIGFAIQDFLGGASIHSQYSHSKAETTGSISGAISPVNLDQSSDNYSVGLSRQLFRKISGSVNYAYNTTNRSRLETVPGNTQNPSGSSLNATITGPFLPEALFPKVTSSFSLGYQKAEVLGINDNGAYTTIGSFNFAWQARERTSVTMAIQRSTSLSILNSTVISTGGSVGIEQAIGESVNAGLNLSYDYIEFRGQKRNSDAYSSNAHLSYSLTKAWNASINYSYRISAPQRTSPLAQDDYSQHVVTVGTSYTF